MSDKQEGPSAEYERGWQDAWSVAHEPAKCGHARANWKDPKYGTPEYEGDEKCEVCEDHGDIFGFIGPGGIQAVKDGKKSWVFPQMPRNGSPLYLVAPPREARKMNDWEKAVVEAKADIREIFVGLSACTSRHVHEDTLDRLARRVMAMVPDPMDGLSQCDGCKGYFEVEKVVAGPVSNDDGLPVWVMCEQCYEAWDGQ